MVMFFVLTTIVCALGWARASYRLWMAKSINQSALDKMWKIGESK